MQGAGPHSPGRRQAQRKKVTAIVGRSTWPGEREGDDVTEWRVLSLEEQRDRSVERWSGSESTNEKAASILHFSSNRGDFAPH